MVRRSLQFACLLLVCLLPREGYAQDVVLAPGAGAPPLIRVLHSNGTETSFYAYDPSFMGGVRVALGDVNGDGVPDIITGAGPTGGPHIKVFSGTDHSLLASFFAYSPFFTGGVFVAAGDVNGDGRADIITGPDAGLGPQVEVFSGADFSLLMSFNAYTPVFTGGVRVAAGDVNGDGRADIITGAGPGGGPHVEAFSGTDLSLLASFYAYSPLFTGGVFVASGDFDGDGRADIVTGAGPGGGPHVEIFSGANLSLLASFYAYSPSFTGGVRVGAVDVDGDGRPELVTGAGPGGGPHVEIFSANLTLLASFYALDPIFTGGVFIASPPGGGTGLRITSAATTTFTVGRPGTFDVTAIGGSGAITLTRTGPLPGGVTFTDNGNRTATLAGTPAAGTGGTYPLTLTASDSSGKSATQTFTLTVQQSPTITSANAVSFTMGAANSFTVTTTGFPRPALTVTGNLPSGVTFTDNGDGSGTLAGPPAAGTGGRHQFTITASNSVSSTVQNFTLTVTSGPAITSGAAATFNVGTLGTFTVTAAGVPTPTITESGALPGGVSFTDNHDGTATLSGIPDVGTGGIYSFTITAANGIGTAATQTFTLTVTQAPGFTSAPAATFVIGNPNTFTVTTNAVPIGTFTFSGTLPSGVTFADNGNGTATLSGPPATGTNGIYALTITASNIIGPATQVFSLTVANSSTPMITSANSATFNVGALEAFTVTTAASPVATTITQIGALPAGVTFTNNVDGTATLSGRPNPGTQGVFPLSITASNGGPATTQTFTLTVGPVAGASPTITSANTTTFVAGTFGAFTITTTGTPSPTPGIGVGPLPPGVGVTDNGDGTATIAGTPDPGSGGLYPLVITATNGITSAAQNFTLNVANNATTPIFTSAPSTAFTRGVAGTFTITTSATPSVTTMTTTGTLPSGVSFVDNGNGTATLAGTPTGVAGLYSITLTASGPGGPTTQSYTLKLLEPATLTSASSATFSTGVNGVFTVTTAGAPTAALFGAGALPAGVNVIDNGDGTATLSGTPGAGTGGPHALTFTALNGVGTPATQSFTLTINDAGGFTSADNTTFTVGSNGSFLITTTAVPTVTSITRTGTLPSGVSFTDNGNGTATLSGTPAAGTGGTYLLTFTASNGVLPNPTQAFMLTVNQAPAITSAATTTFTTGVAGSFTVTTSGFPTSTLAIGGAALPSGVSFVDNGNGTGTLNGPPAAGTGGIYALTFTATNAAGSSSPQAFTFVVNGAPSVTSANATTFTTGNPGTFTVTTIGFPLPALTIGGALPAGVTFVDNGNGTATLGGPPAVGAGGVYALTFTASNGVLPNAVQSFTLTVNQPPAITSAATTTFSAGVPGTFTVTTSGFPQSTLAIGGDALPSGVAFVDNGNGTGTLSGPPAVGTEGAYALTFTATNTVGVSSPQAFTLTVNFGVHIGEIRFRGPAGVNDEYINITNNTDTDIVVATTDASAGWALVGADGVTRFTIPNGTVLPAHGSYLAVNNAASGFSLGAYPAGAGGATVGSGNIQYNVDIPSSGAGAGVALFRSASSLTLANRLDAVGYSTADPLYREGAGFAVGGAEQTNGIQYAFIRNLATGVPKDTDDNVADFIPVDTNGTLTGIGQHLGMPGPRSTASPIVNGQIAVSAIPGVPSSPGDVTGVPSAVRDTRAYTWNIPGGGTLSFPVGTLSLPRRLTNNTGQPVSRLRLRILDMSTFPSPAGTADLRAIDGTGTVTDSTGTTIVAGLKPMTLELPGTQPNGGGLNATLTLDLSSLPGGVLANGATVDIHILLGVMQPGTAEFAIQVETLFAQPTAPTITSANSTTFTLGTPGTFTVTTFGIPAPTVSQSDPLPGGINFVDNGDGTGTLSGIPAAGTGGTHTLTFTASNGVGSPATQNFTLTINDPGHFTSANSTTFTVGTNDSFSITTDAFPAVTSITRGGVALPSGVLFTDNGNGTATLSGTPAAGTGGTYAITFSFNNGVSGPVTQNFTLTVNEAPLITTTTLGSVTVGVAITPPLTVAATGFPAVTITQTGGTLPSGVAFTSATRQVTGTPTQTGSFSPQFTAANGVSPDNIKSLTLTVVCPTITVSASTLHDGLFNVAYTPTVTFTQTGSTGSSVTWSATGLPAGLAIAPATGVVAGTPTNTVLNAAVTITATDNFGCTGTRSTTITVRPNAVADAFTGIGNTQLVVGAAGAVINTPAATAATGDIKANDSGPGTLTVTFAATSTGGGTIVEGTADGSFVYTPPASFAAASDTFTYTLTDGNGVTNTGTVTINFSNRIWYVNGANATNGDGRSNNPFNNLNNAQTPSGSGDIIYVHTGGATTPGSLTMDANSTLQGAGGAFALVVGTTPQTTLSIPAGTAPTLAGTVTLANNNAIKNVNFSGAAPAMAASGLAMTLPTAIDGVSVTGGTSALSLTNVTATGTGAITVTNSSFTNTSGAEVLVSGGNVPLTINAPISSNAGRSIDIQNRTGGAVSFTGAINDTAQGIFLNANGTSTFSFTGALTLSTSTNPAFTATSSGTVSNSNLVVNTITTTTGTALNVTTTAIGAGGLTFRSISSTTASANSGIVLNTPGSTGGLTITGIGATAGSGGTISNKTASTGGISLTSTQAVSLSNIIVQGNSFEGIVGTSVNNFTLIGSSVLDNSNAANNRNGIKLTDTSGVVTFTNNTVTGNQNFNAQLTASGTSTAAISTLTVTGGSYSNSVQNGGFLVDLRNTATLGAAFISGVTFANNFSKGVQFQTSNNAVIGNSTTAPLASWTPAPPNGSLTVTNCTFSNNNVAASFEGGGGTGGSDNVYYRFVNNGTAASPILGTPVTTPGSGSSHTVIFANGSDSAGGTYKGFMSGNFIGNAAVAGSGSGKGNGVRVFMQGRQTAVMTIQNNTIRQTPIGRGIDVEALGPVGAGLGQTPLDVKITNNDVNPNDSTGFPLYAIYVGVDAQGSGTSGSNVHAEIHGNIVPTPGTGACDTQCPLNGTTGMIFYETVDTSGQALQGTKAGTLFQTGAGGSVSSEIASTNTGTAGKTCSFLNGGTLTLTATPVATVARLVAPRMLPRANNTDGLAWSAASVFESDRAVVLTGVGRRRTRPFDTLAGRVII